MRRGLIILLLIVFSIITSLMVSSAAAYFQGYSTAIEPIAPGEIEVPITFHITNLGPTNLTDVTIFPTNIYPFYVYNYYNSTRYIHIPLWTIGETINVTFLFNISDTAKNGVYSEGIAIEAINQYGESVDTTVLVEVPILGYVNFSASSIWGTTSSPMVVGPGENNVPLTIILQNLGNTLVSNVTLELQSQFPVKFLQSNASISAIPAGYYGETTVMASVYPNATEGLYYIKLKAIYYHNATQYVIVPIDIGSSNQVSLVDAWGTPSDPEVAAPGATLLPLTIYVKNLGENLLSNVSLILQSHYPIQFLQENASVGFVPAGGYNYVTVIANVYPNATPGVYYIPVTLLAYNGFKETVMMTVEILGYITLQPQTLWGSINSPITVAPGETQVPLTILLRNTGDVNVLNVTLSFKQTEYPLIFHQTTAQIGIIPAGEENYATLTVSVYPNATPGVYYIPATLYYFNHKYTITIPITIYSPNISINVITIPPQIFPSYYDVRLMAILTNYGSGIAENANISISSPFEVISSPIIHIGAIPVGEPINVTFLINVPNETLPKTYIINFTVTYDGGKITYGYPLNIYPKANLIVVSVYYPTLNAGDTKVPITITLKNTGNATAKNVLVRLGTSDVIYPHVSSSNPLQALTASEVFAGDIPPGGEINITFVVDVSGGASPGTYPLAIALVWNQTGALFPFEQSDTFYVTISPPFYAQLFKSPEGFAVIIAVIIIIIIAIVIFLRVRHKRK